jgi:hypothetical protein
MEISNIIFILCYVLPDTNSQQRRKSASSKCTQIGIYPDILDCSLFHYCHKNRHHEISKCPNGLHFDPKTFICLPSQLVNCQYEPLPKSADEPGTYSFE